MFRFITTCPFDLVLNWVYMPAEWKKEFFKRHTDTTGRVGKKNSNGKQPKTPIIEWQMTQRPQIPAEVNECQCHWILSLPQQHTQTFQIRPLRDELRAQSFWENSAFLSSCQANRWMAGRNAEMADKGELWLRVLLAGKSPSEEAIIYLITLTIPPWKSIRFLLWIAAQEQSPRAAQC